MLVPGGGRAFLQEKRYFGCREMGMDKGTLRVGSRGRASAGEAHASGRANRPYAVRERAGGWEVLPDSAVALGVSPDWDTEETRTLMWLAMGCCRSVVFSLALLLVPPCYSFPPFPCRSTVLHPLVEVLG
jgi:hypothetical protein